MSKNSESNDPWFIEHLDENLNKELLSHFRGEREGYVRVGPKKYFLPKKIVEDINVIRNFKPRPTDYWVVTFPRSGTTWTQEMVWLLANDLDYKKASEISLLERFPFFEFSSCLSNKIYMEFVDKAENEEIKKKIEEACSPIYPYLEKLAGPRFIKTHLPLSLLHPDLLTCGAKVIYVARNPKDVAVSYYNFHQFIKSLDYVGDFETFWNYFQNDLELWTPYWSHVIEGWNCRSNPNFLFIFYENTKEDLAGTAAKVGKFLGKNYGEEDIKKLADHLKFDNFKQNQSVNMEILRDLGMLHDNGQKCIRNGRTGSWREFFNDRLNAQADAWIEKNLKETDLRFPAGM